MMPKKLPSIMKMPWTDNTLELRGDFFLALQSEVQITKKTNYLPFCESFGQDKYFICFSTLLPEFSRKENFWNRIKNFRPTEQSILPSDHIFILHKLLPTLSIRSFKNSTYFRSGTKQVRSCS